MADKPLSSHEHKAAAIEYARQAQLQREEEAKLQAEIEAIIQQRNSIRARREEHELHEAASRQAARDTLFNEQFEDRRERYRIELLQDKQFLKYLRRRFLEDRERAILQAVANGDTSKENIKFFDLTVLVAEGGRNESFRTELALATLGTPPEINEEDLVVVTGIAKPDIKPGCKDSKLGDDVQIHGDGNDDVVLITTDHADGNQPEQKQSELADRPPEFVKEITPILLNDNKTGTAVESFNEDSEANMEPFSQPSDRPRRRTLYDLEDESHHGDEKSDDLNHVSPLTTDGDRSISSSLSNADTVVEAGSPQNTNRSTKRGSEFIDSSHHEGNNRVEKKQRVTESMKNWTASEKRFAKQIMSRADSGYPVNDELKCSRCQIRPTNGRIMRCGHLYCFTCLQILCGSAKIAYAHIDTMRCPRASCGKLMGKPSGVSKSVLEELNGAYVLGFALTQGWNS